MKHLTLSSLFLLCLGLCSGQTSFFHKYPTQLSECGYEAIQNPHGGFIIVGEADTSSNFTSMKGYILKISEEGVFVDSLIYSDSFNNLFRFHIVFRDPKNQERIMIAGTKDSIPDPDLDFNHLILLSMDENLNILEEMFYPSPPEYCFLPWKHSLAGDSICYLECVVFHINISQQTGIIKIRLPFDSVTSYITPEPYNHLAVDVLYLNDINNVSVFYIGGLFESTLLKIAELDADLNFVHTTNSPDHIITTPCASKLTDSTYILTATHSAGITYPKQHIVSFIMSNSNDTIKKLEFIHHPDTILYAGGGTNTAINGEAIFISSVYNINPQIFPWQDSPTWIQITKTDKNLNILSQHFFGGDCEYFPYCITPTSDGGAFVTGFAWDYTIPGNYQWDIFALKVDTSGTITNIPEETTWQMNEAILAPNPGSDHCMAILGAQHPSASLELFDMTGKQVFQETLCQQQTRINTASLQPGTYVYRFFANGILIGSGKWIKQ